MLTWQEFYEARESMEKKEERLHKDLDNDGEKGESKKHKEKVFEKCDKCKMAKKKCQC